MPMIPSRPLGDLQPGAAIQATDSTSVIQPAGQTLPADSPAKAQAVSDSLSTGSGGLIQGSAQVTLALNADEASALWKQAGQGSKLALTPKADARMPHLGALMEYVKNAQDLSADQKGKFATFLREFTGHGAASDQAKALRQLEDLLSHSGITRAQLMLIAHGKFSAADLNSVLRGSAGPSLLGQAPTTSAAGRTASAAYLPAEPAAKTSDFTNAISATPPAQRLD